MNSRFLLLATSILCAGCSWSRSPPPVQPVEVVRVEVPAPVYHPVLPDKISPLQVEWTVLTPDLMREYITDLDNNEAPVNIWYAVSTKGYENLSANMSEVKRYIRQVLNIVDYYKGLNEESEEGDDELTD